MGQSGSGKSTLLYTVSGMDTPTTGIVRLVGSDLAVLRFRSLGFVFQHNHLLDTLTIADNIILQGLSLPGVDAAVVRARADELMESVGITEIAKHGVGEVSGGQPQRAAASDRAVFLRDGLVGGQLDLRDVPADNRFEHTLAWLVGQGF